jgi:malonyl CoA-acyl carrier protein transacylase
MKIAFLYAGQGSQYVGMGKSIYDHYPTAKTIFDSIKLDFDVKKCCFEGPEEVLNTTEYTQPAMVLVANAITAVLKEKGIIPDVVAGLSLGEYSALCASGVFNPQTGIELVRFRGQVMQEAVKGIDSSMQAVLGLDRETLQQACIEASKLGVVEIANYNCPGQLVIAGEKKAVELAGSIALDLKARRVLPLNVSGPFHTSLLKDASIKLEEKFKNIEFNEMNIPVVFNTTATYLKNQESIPTLLEKQVMSSVYFEDSIRFMINDGVDTFIEIGPGKILSSFVKKIDRNVTLLQIEDQVSLENVVTKLKGDNKNV